ncbi:proline-specific permease ProY, partial [Escherichia coli]|nr:proline-specific permease ProY [Escherichia coli]
INADTFGAGRMLFAMSEIGHAPKSFGRISRNGVPWMTVVVMAIVLLVGVVLNALLPEALFTIIASIATFATVWVWIMILTSYLSMRRKEAAAGRGPGVAREYAVPGGTVAAWIALAFMVFVVVLLALSPATRVALYTGIAWLVLLAVLFK